MEVVSQTPNAYLKSLKDDRKSDMLFLDKAIAAAMEDKTRILWQGKFWGGSDQTIIGYGDYVYQRPGKPDIEWFKVGLALQKNYISIYLNAIEEKEYVAKKYGKDIGKVKVGNSNISFRTVEDIDIDKLITLVIRSEKLMT